jgi:hypothetical protein
MLCLGKFCIWDVLGLGRFVLGHFVCVPDTTLVRVQYVYKINEAVVIKYVERKNY